MIKYFTLGDRKIPYKLTMRALQKWQAGQQEGDVEDYLPLVQYAIEDGYKLERKIFDLSSEDIELIYIENDEIILDAITDFFIEVQARLKKVGQAMNPMK
jgi:hypothetical protein